MNDDEFDEMLRARHKAFVADVAAVPRPAFRAATASPAAVSRIAVVADTAGSRLAFLTRRFPSFAGTGGAIVAAATALVLAVLAGVQAGQTGSPGITELQAADPPRPPVVISTVPGTTLPAPASAPPSWDNSQLVPQADSQLTIAVDSLSLRFAPDSVEANGTDLVRLRALAARMRPGEHVWVVGHTARVGSSDTAVEFSLRRALVVKSVLVESGVPASSISASGVGYRYAAAGVDARDRRVAVTVA